MEARIGERVPPELADALVLDAKGQESRLGDRWAEGPAAVIFLRHFACISCTEHLTVLTPRLHELTQLGLRVVYVGNGEPRYIEAFVERNAIDPEVVEVITDPTLAAHRALALPRSFASGSRPRVPRVRPRAPRPSRPAAPLAPRPPGPGLRLRLRRLALGWAWVSTSALLR